MHFVHSKISTSGMSVKCPQEKKLSSTALDIVVVLWHEIILKPPKKTYYRIYFSLTHEKVQHEKFYASTFGGNFEERTAVIFCHKFTLQIHQPR